MDYWDMITLTDAALGFLLFSLAALNLHFYLKPPREFINLLAAVLITVVAIIFLFTVPLTRGG